MPSGGNVICSRMSSESFYKRPLAFSTLVGIVIFTAAAPLAASAQNFTSGNIKIAPGIATVAGGGSIVPSTAASPATSAMLNGPAGVAVDAAGNLYIADSGSDVVEEVSAATGQIVVVAGVGNIVPSTTASPATSAMLNDPAGVAVDGAGNLYIADSGNDVVEEVSAATGQIVVVAGGGSIVPSTTASPATSALLNGPAGVAVDVAGNLYIADSGNGLVEEVSTTTGQIVAAAGGGTTEPGTAAIASANSKLGEPRSVAVDRAGDLYIADTGNNQIDRLSTATGMIKVVAGGGGTIPGSNTIPATNASLSAPNSLVVDVADNLYIADSGHALIEKWNAVTNSIAAVGGGGGTVPSTLAIPANNAFLNIPMGIAVDRAGNIYIVDNGNSRIEKMGSSTTLPATAVASTSITQNVFVQLTAASDISTITVPPSPNPIQEFTVGIVRGCDTTGNVSNPANTICTVPVTFSPAYPGARTGTLTIRNGNTVVGTAGLYGMGQGPLASQYPGGIKSFVGGGSTTPSGTAIPSASAHLMAPISVAFDSLGNLYIADFQDNLVEEVSATTGQLVVVAGGGNIAPSTSPISATSALLNGPSGVAVDGAGDLYIADYGNGLVERVSATTGQIVVVAGGGLTAVSTVPSSSTSALLSGPASVAVDEAGNLYIADYANGVIDEVSPTIGQILTVACGGLMTPGITAIPATAATCNPRAVAVDGLGNLYIADSVHSVIEEVDAATGQLLVVAGGGAIVPSTAAIAATNAKLAQPRG